MIGSRTPDAIRRESPADFEMTPQQADVLRRAGVVELQRLFKEHPETRAAIQDMLERAKRVNEGMQGIIFRIQSTDLSMEQRTALEALGIPFEDDRAIKILKVNTRQKLRQEFNIQLEAYEALNGRKPSSQAAARVPRPLLIGEVELPEKVRDQLGSYRQGSQPLEIMMMEFVHGADIATILFREAYKHLNLHVPEEEIDSIPLATLQEEVTERLKFSLPGGKGKSEEERLFEKRKVENDNAEKLMKYLQDRGFVLPKEVVQRIEQGIKSLHESGIVHRDLHERNIMLTDTQSDRDGTTVPDVFVIDFGMATRITGVYREESDVYTEGDIKYFSDETLLRRLERLTHSREERISQENDQEWKDIMDRVKTVWNTRDDRVRTIVLTRTRMEIKTLSEEKGYDNLVERFSGDETATFKLIELTLELLKKQEISFELASNILSRRISEKRKVGRKMEFVLPIRVINILTRFNQSYLKPRITQHQPEIEK